MKYISDSLIFLLQLCTEIFFLWSSEVKSTICRDWTDYRPHRSPLKSHCFAWWKSWEEQRNNYMLCAATPRKKSIQKKKKNKKLYFPIAHFGILSSRRSVRKSLWMAQHIHTYMHAESASKACHVSAHTHACSAPTLTHSLTHSPIHSPIHSYTLHMHANRTRMWVCTVDTNRHGESLTCATHPFALCIHERCGLWAYRAHQ